MGARVYHHRRRALTLLGGGAALTLAVLALFALSLDARLRTPRPSRLVLDRHDEALTEVPGDGGRLGFWPLPAILPERLAEATRETEDRRFYEHGGVYLPSLVRAVRQNVEEGRVVSGASTLAMQVARMQGSRTRGLWSKLQEAAEAWLLVRRYGHDEVFRQYLTLAPYGSNVHGAGRAARFFFDKPPEDLSWLQAAYLAALPQSPARMNPYDDVGRARGLVRAHKILEMLRQRGRITERDYQLALASDLGLVERRAREPAALHAALEWSRRASARHDVVQRSTLDLEIQRRTARVLADNLERVRERGASNSAAVVLDVESGDVLAWVGSTDYFASDDHGAIDYAQTKRSPGSALKPFIYALGIESGRFTAASPLPDIPLDLVDGQGRSWVPRNINRGFLGPMLLRDAAANSRNIPALRVLAEVGVEPVLSMLERGGVKDVSFDPGRYGLGLALGNLHVTPLELAGLYRALAADGQFSPARFFLDEAAVPPVRLVSADTAAVVTHILADPLARQPSFPVGPPFDTPWATATKTGTSQGYRDGWTAAYTDRLVVVVWVGNHDWRRMNQLGGLAGTAEAAHEILAQVMPLRGLHRSPPTSFPPPRAAKQRIVCALSGQLAGPDCSHTRAEIFLPGSEPWAPCSAHVRRSVDKRNGLLATAACPRSLVEERVFLAFDGELAAWLRRQQTELPVPLLPRDESPLCGGLPHVDAHAATLAIVEPRPGTRYAWDPSTPAELATIRLRAEAEPSDEPLVFLVDGVPVAVAQFPHEVRWTLTPGAHTIQAAFARRPEVSAPIAISVRH